MAEDLVEKVRYEADISDIQSKLRTLADKQDGLATDTERHTGRMKKTWTGFKDLVSSGAAWFAGIAASSAIIIPKLLDSGASLEALDMKARTVFSDGSLAQVQAWAKGVAGSFGLTNSQAIAMATSMADLFKPMGFTADQAAELSTNLGDMSGALSAWSGGKRSAAEVSEILTKAMLGERDGLVELGIKISEADVQARLAANGTAELTGAALEQAKAMATLELIQEKSTDAQKAWTNGSMDAIKKQNEGKASMRQLGEVVTRIVYPILQKLVPILSRVAEWIGERLPGALDTVGKIFSSVFGGGKRLIDDLAKTFGTSGKTIGIVLGSIVAALILVAVAWNAGPGLIIIGVAALVGAFLWAYESSETFRTVVEGAMRGAKVAYDTVATAVGNFIAGIDVLWTKSEGFRLFLEGVFTVAVGIAAGAFKLFNAPLLALLGKIAEVKAAAMSAYERIQMLLGADPRSGVAPGAFPALPGPGYGVVPNRVPYGVLAPPPRVPAGPQRPIGPMPGEHAGGQVFGMPGSEVFTRLLPGELVLTRSEQGSGGGGGGGGVSIGVLNVHTDDSPRRFFDEGLWRVA